MHKKVILLDLDGVLNTYNGNYDENYIPEMREGAAEFLKKLHARYKIRIFTTRNLLLASKWIIANELEKYIENVSNLKEPCHLIIDDRCIKFDGNYDNILDKIDNFEVWHKMSADII